MIDGDFQVTMTARQRAALQITLQGSDGASPVVLAKELWPVVAYLEAELAARERAQQEEARAKAIRARKAGSSGTGAPGSGYASNGVSYALRRQQRAQHGPEIEFARVVLALARLCPDALALVEDGQISPDQAARVGASTFSSPASERDALQMKKITSLIEYQRALAELLWKGPPEGEKDVPQSLPQSERSTVAAPEVSHADAAHLRTKIASTPNSTRKTGARPIKTNTIVRRMWIAIQEDRLKEQELRNCGAGRITQEALKADFGQFEDGQVVDDTIRKARDKLLKWLDYFSSDPNGDFEKWLNDK